MFCARLVELERREGGAVAMLLEVLPHERLCDQVRVHAAAPLHCPHRQGAPVAAQSGHTIRATLHARAIFGQVDAAVSAAAVWRQSCLQARGNQGSPR